MSVLGFILPAASIGLGSLLFRPRRGFFPTDSTPISAQITVEEIHHDELEITEHPVEQGAAIADHAFKRPAEVVIRCAWSNSPSANRGLIGTAVGLGATIGGPIVGNLLAAGQTFKAAQSLLSGNDAAQVKAVYQQLLELQESREPFDVFTGKRIYKDMLFRSLTVETTQKTENSLAVVAVLRQVIIVTTQEVSVPVNSDALDDPEEDMPEEDVGDVQLQDAPTFTSDAETFSGSLNSLQSSLSTVTDTFSTLPVSDLTQVASSVISTLPDAIGQAQEALGSVISNLPSPSEIPLIGAPQSLSVSITGALSSAQSTISGAIGAGQNILREAVQALPAALEQVQPAITDAIRQLPAIVDQLPSAFSSMSSTLETAQTQIQSVLRHVPEVLQRAPLPKVF